MANNLFNSITFVCFNNLHKQNLDYSIDIKEINSLALKLKEKFKNV